MLRADCLPDGLDQLEALRIDGVPDGAELRALPGSKRGAQLQLKVRGAQGPIRWLVNGQLEATLPAREPFVFAFSESGPASLLAVAERGRFARLTVRVR